MKKKQATTVAALGAVFFAMSVPSVSHAAQGVVRQPPLQFWEFRDRFADGTEVVEENNGTLTNPAPGNGTRLDQSIDWGFTPTDFDLDPVPPDGQATGHVFASPSGITFGAQAQSALTSGAFVPANGIGNSSRLTQYQAFIKDTTDATLSFTVSSARIDMFDTNGINLPRFPECPAQTLVLEHCLGTMEGEVIYSVQAYDLDGTFFNTSGGAKVSGWEGNFVPTVWKDTFAKAPFWSKRNFTFDPNAAGPGDPSHARLSLNAPMHLRVDLSSVPVGGLFAVRADVIASALDRRSLDGGFTDGQGSGVTAFLQDPQQSSGSNIKVTGVHAVPDTVVIPPPDDPTAPVECPTGIDRRAGTLQFSAPAEGIGEWAGAAPVVLVTREGGRRGAVSADVTTSDGTATAGSDYTPVTTTVTFADGETTPQAVTIPITQDLLAEDDKTVNVALSDPVCTTLGAQSSTVLTIVDDDRPPPPPVDPPTFTVGGTVTGLEGRGLVLDSLGLSTPVDAAGPFQLPGTVGDGALYDVRVVNQPTDPVQICTVNNGFGVINTADVTDIEVACETPVSIAGLDPGFGSGGLVATPGLAPAQAVVVQPDGKLLVAGDHKLARYLPDGTLDGAFGTAGVVTTGVDAAIFGNAIDLALQPDGKIVVVGVTDTSNEDFVIERYDTDGAADTSFGLLGRTTTDFHGFSDRANSVAIQPDGKIVVAGDATNATFTAVDYALARYDINGVLDPTFGTAGLVTTPIDPHQSVGDAVAIQPDGKIIVAGRAQGSGTDVFIVARYDSAGQLDPSFATAGVARPAFIFGGIADGVAVQADGKIVAVGSAAGDIALARLNIDGSADVSFGTKGLVTTDFGLLVGGRPASEFGNGVAIQADGKIVVVGTSQLDVESDLAVVRYDTAGVPDPTFDGDGIMTIDFFGSFDGGNDVAI